MPGTKLLSLKISREWPFLGVIVHGRSATRQNPELDSLARAQQRGHGSDRVAKSGRDLLSRRPGRAGYSVRQRGFGGGLSIRRSPLALHASQILDQALTRLIVLEHIGERPGR